MMSRSSLIQIKLLHTLSDCYSFESCYGKPFVHAIQIFCNGQGIVFHECLVKQSIFFVELVQFPFCNLVKHSFWFPFSTSLLSSYLNFSRNDCRIYIILIYANWFHSINLHGNIPASSSYVSTIGTF